MTPQYADGPGTYVGTVCAENGRGVQLATANGTSPWLNKSAFRPGNTIILPITGQRVAIETDNKGFVKSVRLVEQAAPPIPAPAPVPRPAVPEAQPSHLAAWDDDLGEPDFPELVPATVSRETAIIRQSSAKTAFEYASATGLAPREAFALAAAIEQWVTRSE